MAKQKNNTDAKLGFEDKLWAAADKPRGNMDAAEYKHVVLGLIFLKYISDAFMEKFKALQDDKHADPEDKDEYVADSVARCCQDDPGVLPAGVNQHVAIIRPNPEELHP